MQEAVEFVPACVTAIAAYWVLRGVAYRRNLGRTASMCKSLVGATPRPANGRLGLYPNPFGRWIVGAAGFGIAAGSIALGVARWRFDDERRRPLAGNSERAAASLRLWLKLKTVLDDLDPCFCSPSVLIALQAHENSRVGCASRHPAGLASDRALGVRPSTAGSLRDAAKREEKMTEPKIPTELRAAMRRANSLLEPNECRGRSALGRNQPCPCGSRLKPSGEGHQRRGLPREKILAAVVRLMERTLGGVGIRSMPGRTTALALLPCAAIMSGSLVAVSSSISAASTVYATVG